MERVGHKIGYRMKDTAGQYAPIVDYLPDPSTLEPAQAEMLEQARLSIASIADAASPVDAPIDAPTRGFGKGYEGFAEDIYSSIDVEKLVHDLKEMGVEHVYSSMDAGHYVCDFAYYCSLAEAKRTSMKHDKGRHTKVLFMHCSPAGLPISTEDVVDAVKKIVMWVCRGGQP